MTREVEGVTDEALETKQGDMRERYTSMKAT